jgi:hypothetical protein
MMSAKTMYISEAKWRKISPGARKQLCATIGKAGCVGEYACNVTSALHARGEHSLAHALLAELDAQIGRDDA